MIVLALAQSIGMPPPSKKQRAAEVEEVRAQDNGSAGVLKYALLELIQGTCRQACPGTYISLCMQAKVMPMPSEVMDHS